MSLVRFGAGFRTPHFDEITRAKPALDWFEVVSDNFLGVGGARRAMLDRLRADHPILLHGVSLSIAGSDPLDGEYLRGLRALCDRVQPEFASDHLCWTALGGRQSHDLLPVALRERVLEHVCARVAHVQETLGRRLTLENASVYVAFRGDEMSEAEFFRELCRRSGCGMLLDVNNLYVNAQNLGIDPLHYLAELPRESVDYMHLAGHAVLADVRIDTHDADVPASVWDLFDVAARLFPDAGVIVERDDNLPAFAELCQEVTLARVRHARALEAVDPEPRVAPPRTDRASGAGSISWHELQAEFWQQFVDRGGAGPEALVDASRPVSAARGMRVYSDAYATSLPRALAVNFPALARVVDPADWSALCAAYLRGHPPRGHDFRALGANLADFVRDFAFARDYGIDPSVLAELVALEQAQLDVQDEVDESEPIAPAALASLSAEQWQAARFRFVRALRIVRASHDVLPVVEAVARGETPERPKAEVTWYLVSRSADQLHTQRIHSREAELVSSLVSGRGFAEACEIAQAAGGADLAEIALDAVRLLVSASERGLILCAE
jgi:hypothetical protein